MSWREVAKRARQRDTGEGDGLQSAATLTEYAPPSVAFNGNESDEIREAREEREAIAIHCGGLPESWAVALAALRYGPRPASIVERDWEKRLGALWQRADEHGAEFAACGWTFEEVFGVGESWLRLDQRGAAWFAQDARIVSIDPQRIVFERRSGERTATHRKGFH